ncbi:MAG: L-lactate permease, partial [Oxalobacteraceae bacterium]
MAWQQIYDPFGSMVSSSLLAAIPVVVMLVALGFLHIKAHVAAALGLAAALLVAVFAYQMPAGMAGRAALLGGFTGLLPIGWIVLNIIFLQQLCVQNGSFKVLQASLSGITGDRRLQLLLIAFCFGAFFEGAAGFGTPVAVTAGVLIGLGFSPLAASGLSLIANTAPVAFGALGTPVITLAKVHGYDLLPLTAVIGRQLTVFCLLVPFWLIWAFAGRKAMMEIWPAILVTAVSFAIPQYLMSNFVGPELVAIVAALVSMTCLILFLRVWQPKTIWTSTTMRGRDTSHTEQEAPAARETYSRAELVRAWMPWLILTVFVFIWGLPPVKDFLNSLFAPKFPMDGLHNMIIRVPPVVPTPHPESAIYTLNLLSATGTAILLAAIAGALFMKFNPVQIVGAFFRTVWLLRYSLLTIVL